MAEGAMETDDYSYHRSAKKEWESNRSHENVPLGNKMEIGTMVEVKVHDGVLYGVIKWIGTDDRAGNKVVAGLELEDNQPFDYVNIGCSDGAYLGKRYFSSNGRAYFTKLRVCKPDSRFKFAEQHSQMTKIGGRRTNKDDSTFAMQSIEGCILPKNVDNTHIGLDRGIQGHHNSCYMDSTLFAMYSFSYVFDVALHRKQRSTDNPDYGDVQAILRRKIVNPLRKKGYVNHESVIELRKYLDKLGNIGGFMTEEKDPEEFVVLLFDKVLKVEPFIKFRMIGHDYDDASHLYQIFAEKDERHALPAIQYLVEYSFLTCDLQLAEIPSVMILQMPRFGHQKLYRRIQIRSQLDISHLLADKRHECFICGETADGYCKECACVLNIDTVYTYLCKKCYDIFHKHPGRRGHKKTEFKQFNKKMTPSKLDKTNYITCHEPVVMELFSVVCIEKSHYVSFVKSGFVDDDESWLFFDSMADRVGGEDGHNIPEVSKVNEITELLNGDSSKIFTLDKKKDEKVLRLFQDASLCFYRYKSLSIYR